MNPLTQEQLDELAALILAGDRGGYYVRYYTTIDFGLAGSVTLANLIVDSTDQLVFV